MAAPGAARASPTVGICDARLVDRRDDVRPEAGRVVVGRVEGDHANALSLAAAASHSVSRVDLPEPAGATSRVSAAVLACEPLTSRSAGRAPCAARAARSW